MIKVDLITGFLGSGKTTFIKQYVNYLVDNNYKVGIIENDFGAVNVDMMLLETSLRDKCDIEMVAGACDKDCHQRRLKTKLIAMGMQGYDRVIVEPSGIFDIDEFFDTLYEEPLSNWYEIGSVITIVDSLLEKDLSKESNYLLASQVANSGVIVLSKSQLSSKDKMNEVIEHLKNSLKQVKCNRILDNIIYKSWNLLNDDDYHNIMNSGYNDVGFNKLYFDQSKAYDSLYFMNYHISIDSLKAIIKDIMNDNTCGKVFRIKGFILENNKWVEINATRDNIVIKDIEIGQEVIIVIGESLNKEAIDSHLKGE